MASFPSYTIVSAVLMLRSIGLGNSYFPTRISESEVGGCSQNSEFSTWKYDISDFNGTIFPTGKLVNTSFRAQWNVALRLAIGPDKRTDQLGHGLGRRGFRAPRSGKLVKLVPSDVRF